MSDIGLHVKIFAVVYRVAHFQSLRNKHKKSILRTPKDIYHHIRGKETRTI